MESVNLLDETIEDIEKTGHTPKDIIFIGCVETGHCCSWEEFKILANVDYHNGYGTSEVALNLCIVFKNKDVLVREEYDGSEWWSFKKSFKKPKNKQKLEDLFVTYISV